MAKPHETRPAPKRKRPPSTDQAFDAWLNRGLHQLFDTIAAEPIPEDLLRLIREDEAE